MKLNIDSKKAQKNLEKHWALYLGGALILLFLVNLISWPKDNGGRLTKVEFKDQTLFTKIESNFLKEIGLQERDPEA